MHIYMHTHTHIYILIARKTCRPMEGVGMFII